MTIQTQLLVLGTLFLLTNAASAQDHAEHHPATQQSDQSAAATEPGQGAFAAIAEIVQILENDPNTDWSKVSISVLREHLVDMDLVTLDSFVETSVAGNSVNFDVTGNGRTRIAIQAMVIAHVDQLRSSTTWAVEVYKIENGAMLVIGTDSEHEFEKLKALGFYGVMATGAHHQEHHMMMASGFGGH